MTFNVPQQLADEAHNVALTNLAVKAKIRQARRTGRLKTHKRDFVHVNAMTDAELERLALYDEYIDNWYVVKEK